MKNIIVQKIKRIVLRKLDAFSGMFFPLEKTLKSMSERPFELLLELTNLCNAKCIFCPYQFQQRKIQFMSDEVFMKAVSDYCAMGGGSVGLTPIVGDALIDPQFLNRVRFLRKQPRIDRIFLTTNAILLNKFGIDEILNSGITSMAISTSGFDEASYLRIYQSNAYQQMKRNVYDLVKRNSERGGPLHITIAIRTDRPLKEVIADPDFKPILQYNPLIDFVWSYTTANGRITREMLPSGMRLRKLGVKKEPCVQTYNGPLVLPDGDVMICSCVAAVDAQKDLTIGNVLSDNLLNIWTNHKTKEFRKTFGTDQLNSTCQNCDMYRDLELYRTCEGRQRAKVNRMRSEGKQVSRAYDKIVPFMGG